MKSLLLVGAAMLFICCSTFSLDCSECSANGTALQKQLVELANALGDKDIINQIKNAQTESADVEKPKEIERQKFTLCENDPNPYEIEKELTFDIPEDAKEVELVFTNNLGQQIKAMNITDRGSSSVKVYMATYMLGNYKYSLIVDGVPLNS